MTVCTHWYKNIDWSAALLNPLMKSVTPVQCIWLYLFITGSPKAKSPSQNIHVASVPCDRIKICGTIMILVIKEQPSQRYAWWELHSRRRIPQSWGVSWWQWGENRVGTVRCTVPKFSSEGIPDCTNPAPRQPPPATSAPGSYTSSRCLWLLFASFFFFLSI